MQRFVPCDLYCLYICGRLFTVRVADGGIAIGPHDMHPIPASLSLVPSVNEAVVYRCASPQGQAVRSDDMQACLSSASLLPHEGAAMGSYHFDYYVSSAVLEIDQNSDNTFLVATAELEVTADLSPASAPVSVVGPSEIRLNPCQTCYSDITDITDVHFGLGDKIHLNAGDDTPILALTVHFVTNSVDLFLFAHADASVSWSTSFNTPSGGNRVGSCAVGDEIITMKNSAAPTMWRYPVNTVDLAGVASLKTYAACLRVLDVLGSPTTNFLSPGPKNSVIINVTSAGNGRNYHTSTVIALKVVAVQTTDRSSILPPPPVLQLSTGITLADCRAIPLVDAFQLQSSPGAAAYITILSLRISTSEPGVSFAVAVPPAAQMWTGNRPYIYSADPYTAEAGWFRGVYFNQDGDSGSSGWPDMYPWFALGGSKQAHALSVYAICAIDRLNQLSFCNLEFAAHSTIPTAEHLQTALRLMDLSVIAPCSEQNYTVQARFSAWYGPRWEDNSVDVMSDMKVSIPCSPAACVSRVPLPSPSAQPTTSVLPATITNPGEASVAARASIASASSSNYLPVGALLVVLLHAVY
jgi:hypothetical protein